MSDDSNGNVQSPLGAAQKTNSSAENQTHLDEKEELTTEIPPVVEKSQSQTSAAPVGVYSQNNAHERNEQQASPVKEELQYGQDTEPLNFDSIFPQKGVMQGQSVNPHKSHLSLMLALFASVLIVLVSISSFFIARWYYQDRVAPGVSFAGESVAGKTAQELKGIVSSKVEQSNFTISDGRGKRTTANLKELGVHVDVDDTVSEILLTKTSNDFVKLNPFKHVSVPLSYTEDDARTNEFLTSAFVEKDKQAVPSSINFDQESSTFTVQEGKDGSAPKLESIKKAIDATVRDPGQTRAVTIEYHETGMPITADVATQAATEANKRLAVPMVIDSEQNDSYTIPVHKVAEWIKPNYDIRNKKVTFAYDQEAIKTYAAKELPEKINRAVVTEKNVKNTKGDILAVTTKGVDGIKIKETDKIAEQITSQLKSGQITPIKAAVDIEPHKVETRTARYDVPDGDIWVEVNLSTQIAKAFKGTTEVKTFPICSGSPKNGDESDLGTFFINVRYAIQTMRGPGYVAPDVKWVSYYNGSEGFHTADWNYDAIAHGDAANRGSHGCINMYEQDAKWIYDNCPIGTMIKVVGAQPTSAVR